MKHTSYKGASIDMELLKFQNQHSVALGNAHMNARGDLIGQGGLVLKTREELLQEREKELRVSDVEPSDIAVSSVSNSINSVQDIEDDEHMFSYNPNPEPVVEQAPTEEILVKPRKKSTGE